jgi:hypothetical protein
VIHSPKYSPTSGNHQVSDEKQNAAEATAESTVLKRRPVARRSGQPIAISEGLAHITLAGGNVFAELGFSDAASDRAEGAE